jgi:hypothetical protein
MHTEFWIQASTTTFLQLFRPQPRNYFSNTIGSCPNIKNKPWSKNECLGVHEDENLQDLAIMLMAEFLIFPHIKQIAYINIFL